jgi:protein TonB
MTANGFLEQRTARPLSLGVVVLLHGAAIAAVLLIKGPEWVRAADPPLEVIDVKLRPPPPPNPPEPAPDKLAPQVPTRSFIDVPTRLIPTPVRNLPVSSSEGPVVPSGPVIGDLVRPPSGTGPRPEPLVTVPPRDPVRRPTVRVDAQFDPRFAGALQPPYPAAEQRNEREGQVRVRVTIGLDGRVEAVEKVSATSDAFWRVTERQALSRWRFKPATVDGSPVQSSKVLSVFFKLDGQ